ncbi:MAG: hypothetical protein DRQ39_05345 [Gammaproteobacteria bacterium]|nr:MAG: hypothetical protein DRQ39_05345 [Gammaproteobacteria bacterium]
MDDWEYFTDEELYCPCCDGGEMKAAFMVRLVELRKALDFPFPISSGFRCKQHNANIGGVKNSYHLLGRAVDITLTHDQAYQVVAKAKEFGFFGVGVSQKGQNRFVHLDNRTQSAVTFFSY